MYRFVDFGQRGRRDSSPMSIQTVFNNINLDEELTDNLGSFRTLTVTGRGGMNRELKTVTVGGMDGALEYGYRYPPREVVVKYILKAKDNESFRRKVDALNRLLVQNKARLEFTDEEYSFTATAVSGGEFPETSNTAVSEIRFICNDPFKYANEYTRYEAWLNFQTKTVKGSHYPNWRVVVRFTWNASGFEIEKNNGKKVRVEGPFTIGDTLEIDFETRRAGLNGSNITHKLSLDSEWFRMNPGLNTIKSSHPSVIYYRERFV